MPTDPLYSYSITLLVILITGGTALLLSRQRIQAYRASRLLTLLLLSVLLQAVLPLVKAPIAQSLMDGLLLAVAPLFLLHLRSLLGDWLSKGRDGYHFTAFAVWSVLSLFPAQLTVLQTSWYALFPELFLLIYLGGSYLYLQSRVESLVQIRSRIPMGKTRWAKPAGQNPLDNQLYSNLITSKKIKPYFIAAFQPVLATLAILTI